MPFELNFGRINVARGGEPGATGSGRFRIALLGDFSARANRGTLERGAALAQRKPIKIDCDNFDKVLQRLQIKLTLQMGSGAVEVPIASLDDFHPEQLFANLELFSELTGLRQRLKLPSGFAKAAAEVQKWTGQAAAPAPAGPARGSVIPEGDLTDFAQLLGQPSVAPVEETPVADLLRQIVGPYIVPAKDPRQDALIASVDEALSATMRSVLHHPDFQALEALWRSVDLLVRRLETGTKLEVVLIDLTAEELIAELSGAEALESSGLYQLLVEQPAVDAQGGAYSALIAHYTFSRTRAHAELLGRLGKVTSAIPAAAIAAIDARVLEENPKDVPSEIAESWTALAALPEAGYLALVTPSFLLRQPYGKRSEPVDCFDFEEITDKTGLHGFLWGNSAVLAGLLLGETSTEQGSKMKPGVKLAVGDLPFYYFTDKDGDQEALPCTEKLVTSREAALATSQGFTPVVSLKGSPEVRLGGFHSVAGGSLAGPWAPLKIAAAGPAGAPAAAAAAPTPEASAPATDGSGDAELDALLSGLDTPEPPPPPAPEPAPATPPAEPADAEMDALLAGLDTPAEEPPPAEPEPVPATPPAEPADAEMDALLAGLDTPAKEPPPAEPEPEPAAPPAEPADADMDALLAGLDTPPEAPPAAEPAAATPPAESADAEMDALLSGLDSPAAEPPAAPTAEAADPEMDALLSGLDSPPAEAPPATPPAPEPEPEPAAPEPPAPESPPAEESEAADSTGDPDLDALLAGLAPETEAPAGAAETKPGDLDPGLADLLSGL